MTLFLMKAHHRTEKKSTGISLGRGKGELGMSTS